MTTAADLAPDACIICGKPRPTEPVPGWVYFAGVPPLGSLACSEACARVAIDRYQRTGRADKALVVVP